MATTFHVTNFKNLLVGWLTGASTPSTSNAPRFIVPYNGAQPADPSATPAGSAVYSSFSVGIPVSTNMSQAGGNISQLASPVSASASSSVSTLTFARIYGAGGAAIIDTPASLTGGGGGVILDSLSSTSGVALSCTTFSVKFPKTNGGTLFFNQALADRIVDNITANNTTPPQFGINTAGSSVINIYSGSAPADADAVATGTLLCSFTIGSSQVFAAASGGSAALSASLTSAAAVATGTAGYARWVKTNGSMTFTIQGSVGTSGTDFIINTTSIVTSSTYTISDATISI